MDIFPRSPLPEFRNPPVGEVVLAVAFHTDRSLGLFDLARFWREHLASEFPRVEEQPPYEPPIESFDPVRQSAPEIQLMTSAPPPRFWLLSEDDTQLIQLQPNWLGRNWRQRENRLEYPRYEPLREGFERALTAFLQFAQAVDVGTVRFTQCEVTYVNHIVLADASLSLGDMHRVFSLLAPPQVSVGIPESGTFAFRYLVMNGDKPLARLHVKADSALRRDDRSPMLVLNLTARGEPLSQDIGGVMAFLDLGHETIVRGFAEATTQEMHHRWGRLDA